MEGSNHFSLPTPGRVELTPAVICCTISSTYLGTAEYTGEAAQGTIDAVWLSAGRVNKTLRVKIALDVITCRRHWLAEKQTQQSLINIFDFKLIY